MRIRFNFVGTREPLKVKNFEIGVARKPDLIEPNCFSNSQTVFHLSSDLTRSA
jgi:hypothetical protein